MAEVVADEIPYERPAAHRLTLLNALVKTKNKGLTVVLDPKEKMGSVTSDRVPLNCEIPVRIYLNRRSSGLKQLSQHFVRSRALGSRLRSHQCSLQKCPPIHLLSLNTGLKAILAAKSIGIYLIAIISKGNARVYEIIGSYDSFTYKPREVNGFGRSHSLRGGCKVGGIPVDSLDWLAIKLPRGPSRSKQPRIRLPDLGYERPLALNGDGQGDYRSSHK